jgi:hypothetical protein
MTSSLKVPNNSAGNGFISDLRKILKGFATIQLRGRNPNRTHLYPSTEGRNERQIYWDRRRIQREIPIKEATYYAVYFTLKDKNGGADFVWGMIAAVKKIYELHGKTVIL